MGRKHKVSVPKIIIQESSSEASSQASQLNTVQKKKTDKLEPSRPKNWVQVQREISRGTNEAWEARRHVKEVGVEVWAEQDVTI